MIKLSDVKQTARFLLGDSVVIGDVITIAESAGGGHAVVLWVDDNKQQLHVTGFYEDGERWHDFVEFADATRGVPRWARNLHAAALAAGELYNITSELAYNMAETEMQWQAKAQAVAS